MDHVGKVLAQMARQDIDTSLSILYDAAASQKKPTVAQLNDVLRHLENARRLLNRADETA